MEHQFCANTFCVKHSEHRGGRFMVVDGQTYCSECAGQHVPQTSRNLWDFVTSHGDGVRTHIKSLGELRAYEKRTGTSNQLANYSEKNCR
jgi:hypothetical protein